MGALVCRVDPGVSKSTDGKHQYPGLGHRVRDGSPNCRSSGSSRVGACRRGQGGRGKRKGEGEGNYGVRRGEGGREEGTLSVNSKFKFDHSHVMSKLP